MLRIPRVSHPATPPSLNWGGAAGMLLVAGECLLVLLTAVLPAYAAWPNQSAVNLPVCKAANDQTIPAMVADGAGGVIIAWGDYRSGTYSDIYAQHVLASGVVDPAWPANGLALCTATNDQLVPAIVGDGAGGAIVTWQDKRGGAFDIYAQHVLASGAVDPAWPADGRAVGAAPFSQIAPTIASDGAGGAIVAFQDNRLGADYNIYAQHVLASGAVDPAWPASGLSLCAAANDQLPPMIASDGAGGAIVAWQDNRTGNSDIYAQHALAGGAVDPAWPADGRALCSATNTQTYAAIVADGSGGAIVTWADLRSGTFYDIYAQHVLTSGAVDPIWPANGRAVCIAMNTQLYPTIIADGAGGAIVTWQDNRPATTPDIYAQHVLAGGTVDPAWPDSGRALCTNASIQQFPTIVTDGAGGAIVTWQDYRNNSYLDVYAQHVLAGGVVDPGWPADGRALSTAANDQQTPVIATDGAGGAIVAWQDKRSAAFDIYAQRVARFSCLGTPEAEIVSVKDVPNDQGGHVKLSWNASYLDLALDASLAAYDVYRSVPPNVALSARRGGTLRILREGDALPSHAGVVVFPATLRAYAWEYVATVSPNHFTGQYSMLAPTAFDSIAGSNPRTAFLVLARNSTGSIFWPSRPDSGYSVDNLPPTAPAPFMGQYASGTTRLHWDPNPEPDLAGYSLYRGHTSDFTPGAGNLITTQSDTGYVDVAGAPYYYKVAAVDIHGNVSPYATLLPSGTVDVPAGPSLAFALDCARPNPATGRTLTVTFTLAQPGPATLELLDVSGRRVTAREVGALGVGHHQVNLGESMRLSPGLYLIRLSQGASSRVTRVAVLH